MPPRVVMPTPNISPRRRWQTGRWLATSQSSGARTEHARQLGAQLRWGHPHGPSEGARVAKSGRRPFARSRRLSCREIYTDAPQHLSFTCTQSLTLLHPLRRPAPSLPAPAPTLALVATQLRPLRLVPSFLLPLRQPTRRIRKLSSTPIAPCSSLLVAVLVGRLSRARPSSACVIPHSSFRTKNSSRSNYTASSLRSACQARVPCPRSGPVRQMCQEGEHHSPDFSSAALTYVVRCKMCRGCWEEDGETGGVGQHCAEQRAVILYEVRTCPISLSSAGADL